MRRVAVIGVGMQKFGKYLDKSLKDLGASAVENAVNDANVPLQDIGVAYVGNGLAGLLTGQEGIRGQVILKDCGFDSLPIVNVENACASGSTAFRGAWIEVASGLHDVALALGAEKMYGEDTSRVVEAIATDTDIEATKGTGVQFSALYAMQTKNYLEQANIEIGDIASIVVKNRHNGCLNPYAQFQKEVSVEDVLKSRSIADPLTSMMCSPIGDGAAATILCDLEKAHHYSDKPIIEIGACSLRSGKFKQGFFSQSTDEPDSVRMAAAEAFAYSRTEPSDIDLVEVHDAFAPAEVWIAEKLGLIKRNEIRQKVREDWGALHSALPINPSGGLLSRGHPIGATGVAQICELVWQLRGEAGSRQTKKPEVALAENGGGRIDGDNAAMAVTIMKRAEPW